jgi:plasmid stability protein
MAQVLVRNLPDEVHRALRVRAAFNNRSTEAEARNILAAVVLPPIETGEQVGLGTFLSQGPVKLTDEEFALFSGKTEAMKRVQDAVERDQWFRAQVAQGLAEADDPATVWVTHEDAQASWSKKRAELVKRAGSAA